MGMDSVFRVSLVLDMVDNMTSKLKGAADGIPSSVKKMNDAFGTMQKAGLAMTGMGTAIAGACMGTVTATFDTQDALAEVASLGVEDLGTLERAAKNFSDTWAGTTKADFISASYDIKSGIASLTDEGVAKYTELAGLTAKATKATTADMTSLFATGYGIYKNYYSGLSDMEFGEMFSAGIATAVKNYKTSGTEMAGAIKMLGASATNANVPMEEQLAILGQLQATMSGSEAGTKYKSFLNNAASAGQKLGLNFMDANNQLLSMPDILEQLHGKYGDTIDAVEKKQLKDAFGTDEAIALIDLLYNNTDQLKSGIDGLQISMDGGIETTNKMAEAINNTPAQKFQVLKQQLHNVTEELGQGLLPSVNAGLEAITGLVKKGSDWIANNQETVSTIMKIVAVVGIFLIAAGTLTAVVGTLGNAMMSLKTVISLASKASGLFNSALLSSPITWVIGLIVALIAVFRMCGGDVGQLSGIFSNVFGSIAGFVGDAVTAIAQRLPEFLQFGVDLVLQIISGISEGLPSLISGGMSVIESLISGIQSIAPTLLSTGLAMLMILLNGILQALPMILSAGVNVIQSLLTGIVQHLPTIISAGFQILSMLVQGIVTGLPALLTAGIQLIQMVLVGIIQNLPTVITAGLQILNMLVQGIVNGLPQLLAQALQLIPLVLQAIASGLPSLIVSGIQIISMILSGLVSAIPILIGMIPELFSGIADAVTSIDWIDVGSNLMGEIKEGFMAGFESMVDTAKGLWSDFKSWFFGDGGEAPETNPVSTVASGMESEVPRVESAVQNTNQAISGLEFNPEAMQQKGTESMQALADGITAGASDTQSQAQTIGQNIMDSFNIDTSGAGTSATNLIDSVTSSITENTGNAQAAAQTAGQEIMNSFNIDASGAGSAGENLMQSVMDSITTGTAGAESAAQTAGQSILGAFDSLDANGTGLTLISDITDGITAGTGDTTEAAQAAGNNAMDAFRNATASAGTLGSQMMSRIAAAIRSGGSEAVSTAYSIASQIKAAFENMHITVPRPSLPHISVSYSTVGDGKASATVPNFSVSYYAKGAIMKKPAMFGMNGLSPMVGGEAGEEAIVPLDSLWGRMKNIVSDTFTKFLPGGKKQYDPEKENGTGIKVKGRTWKQDTTADLKADTRQQRGSVKYQTFYVTQNIDAQSIDELRKLKKILSELDGDNDPVPA